MIEDAHLAKARSRLEQTAQRVGAHGDAHQRAAGYHRPEEGLVTAAVPEHPPTNVGSEGLRVGGERVAAKQPGQRGVVPVGFADLAEQHGLSGSCRRVGEPRGDHGLSHASLSGDQQDASVEGLEHTGVYLHERGRRATPTTANAVGRSGDDLGLIGLVGSVGHVPRLAAVERHEVEVPPLLAVRLPAAGLQGVPEQVAVGEHTADRVVPVWEAGPKSSHAVPMSSSEPSPRRYSDRSTVLPVLWRLWRAMYPSSRAWLSVRSHHAIISRVARRGR